MKWDAATIYDLHVSIDIAHAQTKTVAERASVEKPGQHKILKPLKTQCCDAERERLKGLLFLL